MSNLDYDKIRASEIEFLAEETFITIVPSFDHQILRFISGHIGPFTAGFPISVPLWLAIDLRKRGKCKILIPDWLSIQKLEEAISFEKVNEVLVELPFHYLGISKLLLEYAKDDIELPDKVSVLVQDLEDLRMDRLRKGCLAVANSTVDEGTINHILLKNISYLEIYSIKSFLLESMNTFNWLNPQESFPVESENRSKEIIKNKFRKHK